MIGERNRGRLIVVLQHARVVLQLVDERKFDFVAFKLNGDAHLAAWIPAADVTTASANPASRTARSHLGDSLAGCIAKAEAFAPREKLVVLQQATPPAAGPYFRSRERRSPFRASAYLRPAS